MIEHSLLCTLFISKIETQQEWYFRLVIGLKYIPLIG